jgi:hypothetical protein
VSGHLEKLIAAQAATLAPTAAPTLAASGSGATLPAATYYVVVSESNGIGETTASPVSASQAVTLGQNLVVTFPALKTGNVSRNTYVGTAVGGPWLLAADGTTAATVTIGAPLPGGSYAVQPPTANSTGLSVNKFSMLRSAKQGRLEDVYRFWRQLVDEFNRGEPITFPLMIAKLQDAHLTFLALATIANEMGVLIDANPGTLGTTTTGIGGRKPIRTWP